MEIMNSLVVQWLGLHASAAGGLCSIPSAMNPACHGVCHLLSKRLIQ